MAQNLDQLVVQLSADISGLRSQMGAATEIIKKFANDADKSSKSFSASTVALGVGYERMVANITRGSLDLAKSVVMAGVEMQRLNLKMQAAVGGSFSAQTAMAFIRAESDRLGISFQVAADGFSSFAAAALQGGMSMKQVQQVFTGVTEAGAALGLSTERMSLVFKAMEQMASKPTIAMEELKLQLGDHLPGVIGIAASKIGVSVGELMNKIKQGSVNSIPFVNALGDALHEKFGSVAVTAANGAQGALGRLQTAFFDLKVAAASGEFMDDVTLAVRRLTTAVNDPATKEGLSAMVGLLGDMAVAATDAAAEIGSLYQAMNRKIEAGGDTMFGVLFGENGADAIKGARQRKASGDVDMEALGQKALKDYIAKFGGGQAGAASGDTAIFGPGNGKKAGKGSSTKGQIEQLKYQLASETQQLQMEYQKRQQLLEEALKKKDITEKEYRELGFQSELEYKNKFGELWAKQAEERRKQEEDVASAIQSIRAGIVDSSIGLLQTLGQKNKTFALAAIALEKAKGIAEVLIASKVAAAKALAIYGPTPQGFAAAATAINFGYIQAGLIAATGLAEAAQMSGSGNGASSGSSDNFSDGVATTVTGVQGGQAQQPKIINLTLTGSQFTPANMRELADSLTEFIGDGSVKLNVARAA